MDNYREASTWEGAANTKVDLGLRMLIWPKQIYARISITVLRELPS